MLEFSIDPDGLEVLSLLTGDKYFQAEVFGLFRRRHGDHSEERLREAFAKSMKRLLDAGYVVIRPRGNSEYTVAEDGFDAALALFDSDALEWGLTDRGLEVYYSFGPIPKEQR